jgi:hypothetical protein
MRPLANKASSPLSPPRFHRAAFSGAFSALCFQRFIFSDLFSAFYF